MLAYDVIRWLIQNHPPSPGRPPGCDECEESCDESEERCDECEERCDESEEMCDECEDLIAASPRQYWGRDFTDML